VLKAIITARIDEINAAYPKSNGQFKEFYANGLLKSTGKMKSGDMHGAWKWFRRDGTLKRSGGFKSGVQVGEWVTHDAKGKPYKTTDFGRG
jgi:antitoxin component YwqK of YwqJK toxin-antitoxin module